MFRVVTSGHVVDDSVWLYTIVDGVLATRLEIVTSLEATNEPEETAISSVVSPKGENSCHQCIRLRDGCASSCIGSDSSHCECDACPSASSTRNCRRSAVTNGIVEEQPEAIPCAGSQVWNFD